jgi:beta-mannanase
MANRERIKAMYPGDAYVDWVGYDPYNFYSCNGSRWESPMESLKPFYDWLNANITSTKPVLLGEYGSVSDSNDPQRIERWYAELAVALAAMPKIRAVTQWNSSTSAVCDFRISRDPQALEGFIAAGQDAYVIGNR